jgi:cation/acetate symporter
MAAQVRALRAADAPLNVVQQAERHLNTRPRTEAQAREIYQQQQQEARLRAQPLAGMPPQAQAYPGAAGSSDHGGGFDLARRNFIALVLSLMLGTAAMPHILTRYYTTPSVSEARRSVAWSLFFIALLYLAAPALAVLVKYEVFSNLIGTPFDDLPGWIRRWAKLDPSLVAVEDINGDGLLQLAELKLGGDVIVLAAPEIGGLPLVVTYLVAAGGLAAALSTADGLLLTISNALSHDLYFRLINPRAPAVRRVMVSKFLVLVMALLAAFVASLRLGNILQLVSAAFSLAAAAFFPAFVLGIFWRRASRQGAVLGMLSGLAVCLYYMLTNHPALRGLLGISMPLEQARWWGIDPGAAGVFGVPVGALVLVLVSLLGPRPQPDEKALVDRMRYPDSGWD